MNDKANQLIYLRGYREGFESALKIAWAYAEILKIEVGNIEKEKVEEYIKKLTN